LKSEFTSITPNTRSDYRELISHVSEEVSGLIQFHYGGSPYESLGVQREPHESTPDLASAQDEFSLAVQDMEIVFNSQGERSAIRVADYDILYQAFEVEEGEHTYPGYIGAWLCDASNRLYII
jgi:hypothetical protein